MPNFHCIKIHLDGLTWNEKKVSLQSFAMHKKVNWYMNKTIIFTSLISQGWIMTMKSHLTISNDS